jgi:hypothetical protein
LHITILNWAARLFSNPKSQFGLNLEGLEMEDVSTFYGHFVYSTFIWYILSGFGISARFGMFCPEKSGNPDVESKRRGPL